MRRALASTKTELQCGKLENGEHLFIEVGCCVLNEDVIEILDPGAEPDHEESMN